MANMRRVRDLPEPSRGGRSGNLAPSERAWNAARRDAPAEPSPESRPDNHVISHPLASTRGSRGFRSVLRNHHFQRLWLAQLISQTIMNASNYGLIVLIAKQSRSFTLTSVAIVMFSLPAAIFAAPAGVLVDRWNRRRVLWVSNALRSIAAAAIVISLFINGSALIPIYLLIFFTAMVGQFFTPAEGAAIPLLVHQEELINALALFNITFTLAQALGIMTLGPAILLLVPAIHIGTARHGFDLLPIHSLFLIVAVLYVVCMLLILSIPSRRMRMQPVPAAQHRLAAEGRQLLSIWVGIVESWQFIRRDRRLFHSVLQLCLGGVIVAVIAMIAPNFAYDFFHKPPEAAVIVFVPAGVGLVLGSMFTPHVVKRLHYARAVMVGVIMLSLSTALLTLARALAQAAMPRGWWNEPLYFASAIFLTFLIGVALDFINIPAQTLMQERSPDWIKGRVLAVQGLALNGATVPVVLLMGVAADVLSISTAMDILAVVVAAIGLISVHFAARATAEAREDVAAGQRRSRLLQ